MLKWINRYRVDKENGHVTWVDIYKDIQTNVQYLSIGDSLVPRYNIDGSFYTEKE